MQDIASCTFTYEAFPEVMGMLWKRMLHDERTNWRRIYKSLLLLDYLVKNGSERVVTSAREHVYDLRSLENYTHVDQNGKDQGINIRHKVTDMLEFIQDGPNRSGVAVFRTGAKAVVTLCMPKKIFQKN